MAFKNANHPELRSGEIFLTNADQEGWSTIGWKSKRKGQIAYDRSGNRLFSTQPFFPVFVEEKELADAGIVIRDEEG